MEGGAPAALICGSSMETQMVSTIVQIYSLTNQIYLLTTINIVTADLLGHSLEIDILGPRVSGSLGEAAQKYEEGEEGRSPCVDTLVCRGEGMEEFRS